MQEAPIVRHFVACEDIVLSDDANSYSLIDVMQVIRPPPGDSFPCISPVVCLFTALANGRGEHTFAIQLIYFSLAEEDEVYRTPDFTRNLGQEPLTLHGLPIRLRNLIFPQPGQYEFRLLCNDVDIAAAKIEAREAP